MGVLNEKSVKGGIIRELRSLKREGGVGGTYGSPT